MQTMVTGKYYYPLKYTNFSGRFNHSAYFSSAYPSICWYFHRSILYFYYFSILLLFRPCFLHGFD